MGNCQKYHIHNATFDVYFNHFYPHFLREKNKFITLGLTNLDWFRVEK